MKCPFKIDHTENSTNQIFYANKGLLKCPFVSPVSQGSNPLYRHKLESPSYKARFHHGGQLHLNLPHRWLDQLQYDLVWILTKLKACSYFSLKKRETTARKISWVLIQSTRPCCHYGRNTMRSFIYCNMPYRNNKIHIPLPSSVLTQNQGNNARR